MGNLSSVCAEGYDKRIKIENPDENIVSYNSLYLLTLLEAAIGIEPMSKGFAVRTDGLLLSVTYRHEPIFTDLFEESRSISNTPSYGAHTINIRYIQNA